MKPNLLIFLLFPIAIFAQSNTKNSNLTEDRIKVLVNDQTRIIENELKMKQEDQLKIHQQEFELRAKTAEQKILINQCERSEK